MAIEILSPCKVNLILNILEKRPDGFHELETVMQPVPLHDLLHLETGSSGIQLTCNHPELPVDSRNLVYRAAELFLNETALNEGVRIHLDKKLPMAAGLGGGSANAAVALRGLNCLFNDPLPQETLVSLAASLGSDIPFFLQDNPALATGRGEQVRSLEPFPALKGVWMLLWNPGFGISTAWSYRSLTRFPDALHGNKGRAESLIELLQSEHLEKAGSHFYNSLEAPAREKYPVLDLVKSFLCREGAAVALMSGSGSTMFGLFQEESFARKAESKVQAAFGKGWTAVVCL